VTAAGLPATVHPEPVAAARRRAGGWLLAAGVAAFACAIGLYTWYALSHPTNRWMEPVDLRVYTDGGLIARHVAPLYRAHLAAPLYDRAVVGHLKFTYPPFAAMVFTVLSVPSFSVLMKISVGVNIAALLGTIWMTLGGLGYHRGQARLGATLLAAAALLWMEPVQRTLFLGQVELVLMALIIWDQCQPDRRWWKGAGIGIAAGIKLVPLIFIPYLLLTRRFRQAAVACGVFAATVLLGFAVLPGDSAAWWIGGLFDRGSRTGFVGWEGNQSLQGFITRLAGSVAGAKPWWLAAAVLTGALGLACAAILDRAGHRMAGLLSCALTGLLISPISWDHHWVWIVPAVPVAAHYAIRARRAAAGQAIAGPLHDMTRSRHRPAGWAAAALAAGILLVFGAWPGSLWGQPADLGAFSEGLIWAPPNTNPGVYYRYGDRPWYAEYHWHGLYLIAGNLYILAGMALLVMLLVISARALPGRLQSRLLSRLSRKQPDRAAAARRPPGRPSREVPSAQ
jgi:alpha-1,2-mannosyltransferase